MSTAGPEAATTPELPVPAEKLGRVHFIGIGGAGMSGIARIMLARGLPAAYVPLPIGNGEQELIARPVVDAGGGLLVDDADCTADWVRATLTPLLTDAGRLATMGRAAASSGRPDADERLVDLALEAVGSGSGTRGGRRW